MNEGEVMIGDDAATQFASPPDSPSSDDLFARAYVDDSRFSVREKQEA